MKVCGIVCEYNPFHNGHRHHIEEARRLTQCDILVCVMSGNFVQRGEMAICDKWTRAKTAVEQGCDLVLEIPFPFVVQRGDRFAHGALNVLKQANVDSIVFGSEGNDIEQLCAIAKTNIDYKQFQTQGISSAKALEVSLDTPLASNDMLAVFYIKEILDTNITPYCIQRTNTYHDTSMKNTIASASAIRKALKNGEHIEHTTCMHKEQLYAHDWDTYYPYIQTLLLTASKSYLSSLFLMDEGIESLLKKQASIHFDGTSFINACISKRYTRASIQRTLTHLLTQTRKEEIDALEENKYLRVLAYNTTGQAYLRTLQDAQKQIVSTFSKLPEAYRELEYRSTLAYAHGFPLSQRENIIKREKLPAEVVK